MSLILSILLAILLLEIFLAFVAYPLKSKKKDRKSYYWVARNTIYKFDPVLGHSLRPNLVYSNPTTPVANAPRKIMNFDIRTDGNGFLFTDDLSAESKNHKLIFCLGDSITMGSESPHDRTYPAILDGLVRAHGYRCINAGVGGYRSYHQFLFLRNRIMPLAPSAVVLYTGWNDFADFVYNYYAPYNQFRSCLSYGLPSNRIEAVLNNSALFHTAKKMMYAVKGNIRQDALSGDMKERFLAAAKSGEWMNEWRENIRRMADLCRKSGTALYILSVMAPVYRNASVRAKEAAEDELNMGGCFDVYADFIDAANDTLMKICDEEGARFIDARPAFEEHSRKSDGSVDYNKRFLLFVDRAHFSEGGNELIARSIYKDIQKEMS